ncbi:MAG: VOC family protein [Acidimicrobiales bacterium]|jgi:hypothetical protein
MGHAPAIGGGAAITLVTWFDTMIPGSMRGIVLNVADIEAAVTRLRYAGPADRDAGQRGTLGPLGERSRIPPATSGSSSNRPELTSG